MLLPCVFQNEITGWENTTLGSSSRNWAARTRCLPHGMPSFQPQLQQNFTWPLPSLANDFYSLALKRFCLEVYPTVHVYTLHQRHILGFQVFDHYSVYPGRKIVSLCLLSAYGPFTLDTNHPRFLFHHTQFYQWIGLIILIYTARTLGVLCCM